MPVVVNVLFSVFIISQVGRIVTALTITLKLS
jgi:hypothetical protein